MQWCDPRPSDPMEAGSIHRTVPSLTSPVNPQPCLRSCPTSHSSVPVRSYQVRRATIPVQRWMRWARRTTRLFWRLFGSGRRRRTPALGRYGESTSISGTVRSRAPPLRDSIFDRRPYSTLCKGGVIPFSLCIWVSGLSGMLTCPRQPGAAIDLEHWPVEALSPVDCFHPSEAAHQRVAAGIWNRLTMSLVCPEHPVYPYSVHPNFAEPVPCGRADPVWSRTRFGPADSRAGGQGAADQMGR